MICPKCQSDLQAIEYEGLTIETCKQCEGEWIDHGELARIVRIRDVRFDQEEKRAIAESTTITGVVLKDVDHDLICPKCGSTTDPINYGGDTGIVIDRCTSCRGIWLEAGELEKVQMVVEGWKDALPADLQKYGARLRKVAIEVDKADDVRVSRLPLIGRFINAAVNGILDVTT